MKKEVDNNVEVIDNTSAVTGISIMLAAIILAIGGYVAVGLWAPKPEPMVTVSESVLRGYESSVNIQFYDDKVQQLAACEAKLPPTPTPKSTPTVYGGTWTSCYCGGGLSSPTCCETKTTIYSNY